MARLKTIHRFYIPLATGVEQTINLPESGQVMSLQLKDGKPNLWVLCNPKARLEGRVFRWYVTGEVFEDKIDSAYVGTLQFVEEAGTFVYHLFDVTGDGGL